MDLSPLQQRGPFLRGALVLASLFVVLLGTTDAWADPPVAMYVFPAGGQRGTEVGFRVGGLYMHRSAAFEMLGPGVHADPRIELTKTIWFEGPIIQRVDSTLAEDYPKDLAGRVTIDVGAARGARAWRVSTSQGVTSARPFVVGDLPELVEEEIDGQPLPVSVSLPVTINGRIFPREDVDLWTFEAKAGASITCAAMAAKLGSPFESRLEIRDAKGSRIAESDDRTTSGADALVRFVAPHDGIYTLQIHDSRYGGLQNYVYRLTVTAGPWVDSVFPLGGRRGSQVAFELAGQSVSREPVTIALPADGPARFEPMLTLGEALTNVFALELDDLPELIEEGANDTISAAAPVDAPVVFNGTIERPGDVDCFAFRGTKDVVYDIDLRAARLGSPLDSVIVLFDADGKELARSDDLAGNQTDSQLNFKAPADGVFRLRVEERLASRGGRTFAYRLRVAPVAPPDFRLQIAADALLVNRGAAAKLKLTAQRLNGFAGEIKIECDHLPAGVSVESATIAATANEVELTFKGAPDATIAAKGVSIRGVAAIADRSIARMATFRLAGGDAPEVESVLVAVCIPTPYKVKGVYEIRYADRGAVLLKHLKIDRGGYEGSLDVRLSDRQMRHQQGITGPTITVPAGASEFDYPVLFPAWMEVGRTSRTCVMAVGEITDTDGTKHTVSFTSLHEFEQIVAVIDPGQVSLDVDRRTVRAVPGGTAELRLRFGRGVGLDGEARVELVVPEHIRGVSAEPVVLPPGAVAGTFVLRFAERDCGPFNMPIVLRATTHKPSKLAVSAEAPIEILAPHE
jgi:Bacterial pre-peptidase C-terminal domain